MKRIAVLLALFCSGLLVSSFALADDGPKGKNQASTTTQSKKACKNVSLKGTAGATTFTMTVTKASKAGRDLKGKPISLKLEGKVSVNARMCASGTTVAASTFELRNLKVAKAEND